MQTPKTFEYTIKLGPVGFWVVLCTPEAFDEIEQYIDAEIRPALKKIEKLFSYSRFFAEGDSLTDAFRREQTEAAIKMLKGED